MLHGGCSETGLIEFRPNKRHRAPWCRPSKLAEATLTPALILPTLKPVAKTRRQTKSDQRRSSAGSMWCQAARYRAAPAPGSSSAPQTPTVIPPPLPPPSSRSGVDTVAAVFRVDGAQTGTDAGNAAQLERRAGRPGVVGGEKGSGGERRRSVACLRGRDGLF